MVKELHFMGQKAVSVNIAPVGSVLCVGLLTTCAWMANPTAKTCVLLLGIAISQRCQAATEVGKRKVFIFYCFLNCVIFPRSSMSPNCRRSTVSGRSSRPLRKPTKCEWCFGLHGSNFFFFKSILLVIKSARFITNEVIYFPYQREIEAL